MGGKKSSFSIFSVFKSCFSSGSGRDDDYWEEGLSGGRIFPSDEDRRHWVAEPDIDSKASAFIARFHATRAADSEQQFAA
ncbi:hypothetical protein O6P43_021956 [Quillaja saponaria]|uniref:Uncharacterized protein n=1 Tax=Quillaja saponaria TaxID=32244 RepID=A0AAD7PHR2_QUISA|nr:hypothetical protein O6P43_021956 [Quillaja saponaria]